MTQLSKQHMLVVSLNQDQLTPKFWGPAGHAWLISLSDSPNSAGCLGCALLELPAVEPRQFLVTLRTMPQPNHYWLTVRPSLALLQADLVDQGLSTHFANAPAADVVIIFSLALKVLTHGFLEPFEGHQSEWDLMCLRWQNQIAAERQSCCP